MKVTLSISNLLSKITWICFFCWLLMACHSNDNPYINNLGLESAFVAQIDTAHYTLIKWQDSVIDFGTLKLNDSVQLKYRFQNVGKTPLFIIQVRTSCGCTVASFPKDPVMPGKSDYIYATLQGRHAGEINKAILVVTNTRNKKNNILKIQGVVLPADK